MHEGAQFQILAQLYLLCKHLSVCAFYVNKKTNDKGARGTEMRVGVTIRGERKGSDHSVESRAQHTVLSFIRYFKTNHANVTDLIFLIKENEETFKNTLTISIFDNRLGTRTVGPGRS